MGVAKVNQDGEHSSVPDVRTDRRPSAGPPSLLRVIVQDFRLKARWIYQTDCYRATLKALLTDGSAAMIFFRLMQWCQGHRLLPLAMLFNKVNVIFGNCIIGRGASFGPGFVLIHSTGVVINGAVRGGSNIYIEHQVTIGAERHAVPVLGNDIFVGAGAKIVGGVVIGDGARIGANAVVVEDIPAYATVVGVPARVVRRRQPPFANGSGLGVTSTSVRNTGRGRPSSDEVIS